MHQGKLVALNNYAVTLADANRKEESLAIMRHLKETHYRDGDPYSHLGFLAGINVANTLLVMNRHREAISEFESVLAIYQQKPLSRDSIAARYLVSASLLLMENDLPALAESYAREAHAIREVIEPDAWTTWNSKAFVGLALAQQGRLAEAEPYVRSGWAGLQHRRASIPDIGYSRLHDVGNCLIRIELAKGNTQAADSIRKLIPREVILKRPKPAK
jgi:tetratricopeptide (TPR) repeat protein